MHHREKIADAVLSRLDLDALLILEVGEVLSSVGSKGVERQILLGIPMDVVVTAGHLHVRCLEDQLRQFAVVHVNGRHIRKLAIA